MTAMTHSQNTVHSTVERERGEVREGENAPHQPINTAREHTIDCYSENLP